MTLTKTKTESTAERDELIAKITTLALVLLKNNPEQYFGIRVVDELCVRGFGTPADYEIRLGGKLVYAHIYGSWSVGSMEDLKLTLATLQNHMVLESLADI